MLWFYPKIHSNWQGPNDFVHLFNLSWVWEKMNIIDTDFFCLKLIHLDWQMLNNQSQESDILKSLVSLLS